MPDITEIQFEIDGDASLFGDLVVPPSATGLVVFAHGTGSSRTSWRNRSVAAALHERNLATLLIDLLTEDEEATDLRTRHLRFDVELLAGRCVAAIVFVRGHDAIRGLPVGLFGASTGAGAALVAATRRPDDVAAVVSRGGRPDLAGPVLADVRAPTLLIVGSLDDTIIELNQAALDQLQVERELVIVEGASHLFEEPGTLDEVARLAGDWFCRHL